MDSVVVNGVRIAYVRTGAGPVVVLAGGTGMPPVAWEFCGVRDALVRAGYEVVTYAARGVAPSDAPPAPYSMEDLAGDLAALLDVLGVHRAAVVGYSLGSFTAELLARTRPDLVRSLVLMAGAGPTTGVVEAVLDTEAELIAATGSLPPAFMRLQTLLSSLPAPVLRDDEEQVRGWLELLGAQDGVWASPEGAAGQSAASDGWLRAPDRLASLAGIQVPTLVLTFEHDLYFPPRTGRVAVEALPQGELAVVAGAAHGGLLTHPAETTAALIGFLTRPDAR
ncbi:3-oxoadipate enol-lactonase [Streptomyces sp. CG 926]|uniref:alpha/beta fold hydrolase n=1 Tax=Streptomyces sp. CG 926 TaxID=1882405 RepID=UPI000D6B423A|nr:alpha/beta hydrolase [Streptomyces sp. CG 926]PWK65092.1 3-oxoadipate enol-lactonase [Streptomyces sp. CG 926]